MEKWKNPLKRENQGKQTGEKKPQNKIALQGGSYSLVVIAIVLAILIVVNVFVSILPTTATKFDISSTKLYSITSNTKAVVNALEQDVTIYWIVQSGEEDEIIENLLGKYDSLSDHIEVVKKNPDVYPTFAEQYTDETVANNSLIVESGDRSRYIAYSDIYLVESDMYSYSYNTSFDGEGAITSAIDYVVNEEQPKIYVLEGHGEADLPSTFSEQIEKANMETESLSLLNIDEIPEDAACILVYAPSSDISEEEEQMLSDYVVAGGKLMVAAGVTQDGILENFSKLIGEYGVETEEGIVIEGNRDYYAFQVPYVLMPEVESADITDSLIDEHYYPILPIAQPLTITGGSSNEYVTALLTTSDDAYSKVAGYSLTTYEKEEDDIDGPFVLAVSIASNNDGQIIWFASSDFLNDTYNSYSSGANVNLGMNALSSLVGESEAMAIRSKSLNYNYLTISDSTSSVLKMLMIGIFPIVYLGIGIVVVLQRRRLQHEPV
jgi:ABC-2 type transport system permease protein